MMQVMKNFREGQPTTLAQWNLKKVINATFFFDEDGNEWYESQGLFQANTIKIAFDSDGVIRMVESDISLIYPAGLSVAEVANTTANRRADNSGRWQFIDGQIIARQYSVDEQLEQAKKNKKELLAMADTAIAPLERAVKLGIATDEEQASLEAWELFSVQVNRVDVNNVPVQFPEVPVILK